MDKIRGDKDALTMNIETDGSIDGHEVLPIASKMLVDYLTAIVEVSDDVINTDYIKEHEKRTSE